MRAKKFVGGRFAVKPYNSVTGKCYTVRDCDTLVEARKEARKALKETDAGHVVIVERIEFLVREK